jgi:hypothetical protein
MALVCREHKDPRIVICLDSRLDEVYTSSDSAIKFDSLGHNWFTLLSGDWFPAKELVRFLSARLKAATCPAARDDIFSLVKVATADFKSSPFCEENCRIDLIVGGFINGEPMLISTGYETNAPYTRLAGDLAVVGSGAQIAIAVLRMRKCNSSTSVRRAIYLAYEAKKYSENSPGVGPKTYVAVLYPNGSARSFGRPYYKHLENSREKFGLQPINPEALPDPQFPTDGLPPLPPSPE